MDKKSQKYNLLHVGVPDNQISLYFGVPNNQISYCFDVPNNKFPKKSLLSSTTSAVYLKGSCQGQWRVNFIVRDIKLDKNLVVRVTPTDNFHIFSQNYQYQMD